MSTTLTNYRKVKQEFPDVILLWRIGDFYEAFEADARQFSEACDVALVSRVLKGSERVERVAMAGVPYHSMNQYVNRLTAAGRKVALVEYTEKRDSKEARVRYSDSTPPDALVVLAVVPGEV